MSQPVPLTLYGGVDLQTPAPLARPGTLRDCLNYEVAARDGYTRIAGFTRFDGRPQPDRYRFWRLQANNVLGAFAPGDRVTFTLSAGTGVVLAVTAGQLDVLFDDAATEPLLPDTLVAHHGATAQVTRRDVRFAASGDQATLNGARATLAALARAPISPPPGRPGSDTLALFSLRGRLHAVRDLPQYAFTGGYYTDAHEGQTVEVAAGDVRTILDVTITGEQTGLLTVTPDAGSGTVPAAPIGSPVLAALALSGSLPAAYLNQPYSGQLTVTGGTPPYQWFIDTVEGAPPPAPTTAPDPGALNFQPQRGAAALWRESPAGWTWCPLGREAPFADGGSALRTFIAGQPTANTTPTDTGTRFPTDSTFNGAATSTINGDDGVTQALSGASGDTFIAQGFDLSSIPVDAEVTGIEVRIERSAVGGSARDAHVGLLGLGQSLNRAGAAAWPASMTVATYGGANDLWGLQRVEPADLQAGGFGVQLVVQRSAPGTPTDGGVDYIAVVVHYRTRGRPAWIRVGSTDVAVTVRYAQVLTGDLTTGNAAGWLALDAAPNADKPVLVGAGAQLRSAPGGGGSLLATITGRDRPIFLPAQRDIDANAARYQVVVENFYGQPRFEAAYGAQGCGPAWAYDGTGVVRLRSALPPGEDMPRHLVRHGDTLCLGYYGGLLLFSAVGQPAELGEVSGAYTIELGDRLTNLIRLPGDALGVTCAEATYAYRGLTQQTITRSIINAKRGALEYTAADVGRVVFADGFGVFAASGEEAAGQSRQYLSLPVLPWLQPRLQATVNGEQSFIRPIAGLAVRNKNQYRLYFWDGYILTMTLNRDQPEFTFQRYALPAGAGLPAEPLPVRALVSVLDPSGRERVFASFRGGPQAGMVYELDAGLSFDGQPVPHFIELNPLTLGVGSREKQHDRVFVYGAAEGFATLHHSRAGDYRRPDPAVAAVTRLALPQDTATDLPQPARGSIDFPIEGYDVTLRFDGESADEGIHTLQALDLYVSPRGASRGSVR